jgi:hypothetical protein
VGLFNPALLTTFAADEAAEHARQYQDRCVPTRCWRASPLLINQR